MIGREAERARIEVHLSRLPFGRIVVALEGSPGIGKTTLWQEAVAAARRDGYEVRVSLPTEPDAGLAFAGLGDLLDGIPGEVWSELPEPQSRALSQALMVEGDTDVTPDARALPRAVLTAVRALSAHTPLLIAIDDEQWLDPPTARVLAFIVPRLWEEAVGVLMARRPATGGALWEALVGPGGRDGVLGVSVEPLDRPTIEALVTAEVGRELPRSVIRRIHDAADGNPLYAIAIARELQRRGDHGGDLPIPDTLAEAISQRLRRVGEAADEPLLAVAAASQATLALVQAVTDDFTLDHLDAAVGAEVIELAGDRVRFTHPLLASTHYAAASPSRRRAMHRRLADVVDDPQQRARHVALGAEAPARSVAAVIEQGAAVAAGRGAPETAAGLLEEAARLTPADAVEARQSRVIWAAELYERSGDLARGRELLEPVVTDLEGGPLRARALIALAEAATNTDFDVAEAMLEEALVHARGHDGLCVRICRQRSGQDSNRADFAAMVRHARDAVRYARRADDPRLLAHALAESARAEVFTGHRVSRESLRRIAELADPDEGSSRDSPSGALAEILFWSDDYAAGRPALERQVERARERGEQYELAALLFELGMLEWHAGNVETAEHLHAGCREAREDPDDVASDTWVAFGEAAFAARRGDLEHARAAGERAVALCRAGNDLLIESLGIFVLASIDLWTGDPEHAHARLHAIRESFVSRGFGFVGALTTDMWAVDAEALITLGRVDEAQRVADDLADRARVVENPNAAAIAARCRGMILAARGDQIAALAQMQTALAAHAERPLRPEMARTLLEQGIVQRRSKQKNAAKQSLEEALATFEGIGARMWADRASDELSRVGLRRRQHQDGLTPAQARVVELVCEGMSNGQIASTLYMSQRSVESHLTKAYREFGVRSRAQLVATLAGRSGPAARVPEP
jgi:DNA-binding CsgD family transcriptional regulator/tetratricopeptide (TPR) repeat protein